MSDSDISIHRRLDVICDEFENQWSVDERSDIKQFLEQIVAEQRDKLLRMLLEIDVELRKKAGHPVSADDYAELGELAKALVGELLATDPNATVPPTYSPDSGKVPVHHRYAPPPHRQPSGASPAGNRVKYFGDYEIIEEIARGGMGVVYKARQVSLNRIVALKMILAGQLAGDEEIQRFHAEAEAAANLDHPGIVPIYEIGKHEDQYYFSMGLIEGQSLADKVKDGPLPPREAARIMKKVADAVSYAHENGVIHRDLKPANVLLDTNGEPRVTDFGLAKQVESDSDLTRTGAVMGTPGYMPPEQAAGKTDEVGPRSDVYSSGAILYCLLTGRPPFQAANVIDTLLQVMEREPVSPRRLNSAIPVDLENICLKCLAKNSHQRYSSAADLAADLRRYLAGEPVTARPISRIARVYRWCRRNPWPTTAGVALLMLALLTGISSISLRERLWHSLVDQARSERLASHRTRSIELIVEAAALKKNLELRHEAIETITSPGVGEFLEFRCGAGQFSIGFSEDGEQFAAIDFRADVLKVWSFPSGELLEQRPIGGNYSINEFTGRKKVWDNSRTPDGRRYGAMSTDLRLSLVRQAASQVEIWDLKAAKRLATVNQVPQEARVQVSSDARWLAVLNPNEHDKISIIEIASGEEVRTLKVRGLVGDAVVPDCAFSFNADSTLLAAHGAQGATGIVRIWDIESGEIIGNVRGHFNPTWSTSGYFLATVGPSMEEQQKGGDFVPDERRSHSGFAFRTSYGQDYSQHSGFVHIWRITPPTPTFWHPREVNTLRVAPDGKQVLVNGSLWTFKDREYRKRESVTETGGHWATFDDRGQVFAIDAWRDGVLSTSSRRQTSKAKALTLLRTKQSKSQRYVLREGSIKGFPPDSSSSSIVDGQRVERIDELSVLHTVSVAFSPEGNRLATASIILSQEHFADGQTFLQPSGTLLEIWDLKSRRRLTMWKADGYNNRSSVAFSPDSSKVVTTAGNRLVMCDLPSDTRRELVEKGVQDGNQVLFGAEGKRIYLVDMAKGLGSTDVINILNAETGDELATLSGHKGLVHCMAISPQGKTLASGEQDGTIRLWNCLTGEELARWNAHDDGVTALAFSREGNTLVSGGKDGSVRFWLIPMIRDELSELGLNWNEP